MFIYLLYVHTQKHMHIKKHKHKAPGFPQHLFIALKSVGMWQFRPTQPLALQEAGFNLPEKQDYYHKPWWTWSSAGEGTWQRYLAPTAPGSQLPLNSSSAAVPAFLQGKVSPLWKAVTPCSWLLLICELYCFFFFFLVFPLSTDPLCKLSLLLLDWSY